MSKKVFKSFAVLLLAIVISFTTISLADVGNFNRYDSDSSSSYSDSSTYDSNYSYSGGGSGLGIVIAIAIIAGIVIYFVGKSSGKINSIKDMTNINKVKDVLNDIESLKNIATNSNSTGINAISFDQKMSESDPNFSREKFLSWASDVFIKIQQAWTNRDWKVIRPFESNELFEQHSAQLQEYINNNKINIIERISINSTNIDGYRIEGDKEIICVSLEATMHDYIVDATTREVLEGDKNKDYKMGYILTFYRKYGVKTKEGTSNMSTTNCPNCGAPTNITSAGQCEYCDSVITTGEHDWVLSKIEGRNCN